MARRYRRRRSRGSSGVQLVQIAGLGLILVMILMFRDQIGAGAGAFFGSFDSEDVQLPEETASAPNANPTPPDAGSTDASTP